MGLLSKVRNTPTPKNRNVSAFSYVLVNKKQPVVFCFPSAISASQPYSKIRRNTPMENSVALDRFLWEHKVARKVKVFWKLLVGNFCQYHFCCTLIMGRRKFCARDWWNAEACWFKLKKSGTPHKPTRREHAAPSLHTPHDTQAPSASHQLVWHSIWRYPTKRLHCQLISR